MLRPNGVLVVPPFDAAWLGGDAVLHDGNGCVTFEGKGSTDITVMFKATPGSKRLQPLQRQQDHHPSAAATTGGQLLAAAVEDNYTVIFGSHRNSCLKAS